MLKLNIFFLVATLAFCSAYSFSLFEDGDESDDDDDFFSGFKMHKMPKMEWKPIKMPKMPKIKPINPDDIKKLRPDGPDSHVQGAYISQSSKVEWVNGKLVVNKHDGEAILNKNGEVEEMKYGTKPRKEKAA